MKARKLNCELEEGQALNGLYIIDNNNMQYSNLWTDDIPVNEGGRLESFQVTMLCKYVKYCYGVL